MSVQAFRSFVAAVMPEKNPTFGGLAASRIYAGPMEATLKTGQAVNIYGVGTGKRPPGRPSGRAAVSLN